MESRQFNNEGGIMMGGCHNGGGALWSRWMSTGTLTSSDQWSNLKKKKKIDFCSRKGF